MDFKAVDKLYRDVRQMDRDDTININAGIVADIIQELKRQKFRLGKLGAKMAETRMKATPIRAKVLKKNDSTLGWMYVCSNCKHFVCRNKCAHCGAYLDYTDIQEYEGKVEWEREEE